MHAAVGNLVVRANPSIVNTYYWFQRKNTFGFKIEFDFATSKRCWQSQMNDLPSISISKLIAAERLSNGLLTRERSNFFIQSRFQEVLCAEGNENQKSKSFCHIKRNNCFWLHVNKPPRTLVFDCEIRRENQVKWKQKRNNWTLWTMSCTFLVNWKHIISAVANAQWQ